MYKDKEKRKEASKERMRKMRAGFINEGVTQQGVTGKGVTELEEAWYPNKRTDLRGRPITPVMLSDGQEWYPSGEKQNPIEKSVNLHSGPVLHLDNGSYIHVRKLVNKKSRELLTYLVEHTKIGEDNLRVGVQGPTIKECKKLLEVTA